MTKLSNGHVSQAQKKDLDSNFLLKSFQGKFGMERENKKRIVISIIITIIFATIYCALTMCQAVFKALPRTNPLRSHNHPQRYNFTMEKKVKLHC